MCLYLPIFRVIVINLYRVLIFCSCCDLPIFPIFPIFCDFPIFRSSYILPLLILIQWSPCISSNTFWYTTCIICMMRITCISVDNFISIKGTLRIPMTYPLPSRPVLSHPIPSHPIPRPHM